MRFIYFAHPLGASTKEGVATNKVLARQWIRWIYDNVPDVVVLADWLVTVDVLDDFDAKHRERGMLMNKELLWLLSMYHNYVGASQPRDRAAVWLFGGRVSSGMLKETMEARTFGLPVVDFTYLGEEPPAELDPRTRLLLT